MRNYNRAMWDGRRKIVLRHLQIARSQGLRRLDDLLAVVRPALQESHPGFMLSRSGLRRAIMHLHELGLDPGLDDRSTARKLGRPTRGKMDIEPVNGSDCLD